MVMHLHYQCHPTIFSQLPIAFGNNYVMDPWYSLGSADRTEEFRRGKRVAQTPAATTALNLPGRPQTTSLMHSG